MSLTQIIVFGFCPPTYCRCWFHGGTGTPAANRAPEARGVWHAVHKQMVLECGEAPPLWQGEEGWTHGQGIIWSHFVTGDAPGASLKPWQSDCAPARWALKFPAWVCISWLGKDAGWGWGAYSLDEGEPMYASGLILSLFAVTFF